MIDPDHIVMYLFDVITQVMRCSTVMILKEKHTIIECHAINISWAVDARRCILLYQIKVLKSFAVKVVFHTSQFCRHHFTIENFRIRSRWILQDFWLWSCKCRLILLLANTRKLALCTHHAILLCYDNKTHRLQGTL